MGEVDTLGTTPEELARRLRELYAPTLRQPEVAVMVTEFSGRKVYVGGEVVAPGLIPMATNLTALQAIVQAGGIRDTAELKNVVILRNTGGPEPLFMQLDLKADLEGESEQNDAVLYPSDIVYVPKTKTAKFNLFVKQHITELVPISLFLGLNYVWNPAVFVP